MKIIRNNLIPFHGFRAINLFGILFARKRARIDPVLINHEAIHTRQMMELLILGFYAWYIVEWAIKWIRYKDRYKAYHNISFEREAYAHQADLDYQKKRKYFMFLKYL